MHVLFVHPSNPAQFRPVLGHLARRPGWRCTFVAARRAVRIDGVEHLRYRPRGGATEYNSFHTRTFENAVAHAEGVYRALKARPDVQPDLIVGHSGFGSTIFLRELFDAPIVNYFDFFYRPGLDFRPDFPIGEAERLRARVRGAMVLLDLDNCDAGYTPTRFQQRSLPAEYREKVRVIHDGVDTEVFQRRSNPGRRIGSRTIARDTRIVTYCASGLELTRGFDVFMRAAKIIYRKHPDVVFLVVGSDHVFYGDDEDWIGKHASLREWVLAQDEYDLSKFVFLGRVARRTLARVFSLSDVHVYLTVPFVLGWSLMDALSCGAVVVGSDTEPVREMIRPGENGLLADFFDAERIADLALGVFRDPGAYEGMRRNAAAFIEEHYSADVVVPRILELYERVAG